MLCTTRRSCGERSPTWWPRWSVRTGAATTPCSWGRSSTRATGTGQPLLFQGGRYQHLLDRAPMLSSLPPEILESITREGDERTFEAGELIVREGDPGDDLFVILEGEARVRAERGARSRRSERASSSGSSPSSTADLGAPTSSLPRRLRTLGSRATLIREALTREPRAAWAMLEALAARFRDD